MRSLTSRSSSFPKSEKLAVMSLGRPESPKAPMARARWKAGSVDMSSASESNDSGYEAGCAVHELREPASKSELYLLV